jgi:hypothetical protein
MGVSGETRNGLRPSFAALDPQDATVLSAEATAGAQLTCNRPTTLLAPGQHGFLGVRAIIPTIVVERQRPCTVRDTATITKAPAGSMLNTNPADDSDSATSIIIRTASAGAACTVRRAGACSTCLCIRRQHARKAAPGFFRIAAARRP